MVFFGKNTYFQDVFFDRTVPKIKKKIAHVFLTTEKHLHGTQSESTAVTMHCVLKLKGKGIGITIKLFHKQVNSESIFTRQTFLLSRSQKTQLNFIRNLI